MKKSAPPGPGDVIYIKIDGKSFKTVLDVHGVQRFERDTLIVHLFESGQIDLNRLSLDYQEGRFAKEDYLRFYTAMGISVEYLSRIEFFKDWEIENPAR